MSSSTVNMNDEWKYLLWQEHDSGTQLMGTLFHHNGVNVKLNVLNFPWKSAAQMTDYTINKMINKIYSKMLLDDFCCHVCCMSLSCPDLHNQS